MRYILLAVVLPAMVLSWSGALRTLDLTFYDLGFHLRPNESIDDRIVLVEWTEENIQTVEESIVSDDTLASLIEKIQAQQPRLIAFDIIRDIPEPSPRLSDEENKKAYDKLQNLFRSTPNLIGIEKIIPPKSNPPKVLKEQNQVGATDLPSDQDSMIRRAYTFPRLTEEGKPAIMPYISLELAGKYLEKEGWSGDVLKDNSVRISNTKNSQESIVISPLKTFAGAYGDDKYGLDFLINWRKGKNIFKRISAIEVTNNKIPPDLFFDRVVIIGNVSSNTADRHILPLNRWRRTDKIGTYGANTFGVEIVTQITSSLISAALDGRPLMNSTPQFLNLILYLFPVGIVIIYINKRRFRNENLYSSAIVPTLSITVIAILSCFILHRFGIWFPIAWLLASTWIAYLALTSYLEREKEQNKITALEGFNENLLHNLRNLPEGVCQNQNAIRNDVVEIEYIVMNCDELANDSGIQIAKYLANIRDTAKEIEDNNNKIRKYRNTSEQFLRYCFLNNGNSKTLLDVNQTVKSIVSDFLAENKGDQDKIIQRLSVIEKYDPKINRTTDINSNRGIYASSAALEIVLENLLCNAVLAIEAKAKEIIPGNKYFPKLIIQTRLIKNKIQFIIEDNGIGIPIAYQKRIFLPFNSYRSDQDSQGIGLYLAQRIANLHRGTLEVQSILGKGSKFILTLPVVVNRNHASFFNNLLSFLRYD